MITTVTLLSSIKLTFVKLKKICDYRIGATKIVNLIENTTNYLRLQNELPRKGFFIGFYNIFFTVIIIKMDEIAADLRSLITSINF